MMTTGKEEHVFHISPMGEMQFLYDDGLQDVCDALGRYEIHRAGHVNYDNERNGFGVFIPGFGDLGGVYSKRGQAIQAEIHFLQTAMEEGVSITQVHSGFYKNGG